MPFVENDIEFSARQSCPSIWDNEAELVRYENGALWSISRRAGEDPPRDQHELDKLLVRYWMTVVDQKQATFERAHQYCRTQAEYAAMGAGPLPTDEDLKMRRRLKAELIQAQTKLEKAKERIAMSPANVLRREVQQQRAEHQNAARQLLAQLAQGD